MPYSSPQNTYHQNKIKTAGQSELIVMLYDGAIRNLQTALRELSAEKPRLDTVNNAFNKATNIITELNASLDFEKGGEVARHLFNLYRFFSSEITAANVKKEPGSIPQIIEMLEDLQRAWRAIASSFSHSNGREDLRGWSVNG